MRRNAVGMGLGGENYSIRPSYKDKFCPVKTKQVIKEVVEKILGETKYQAESVQQQCMDIAETVRNNLKDTYTQRYKVMVQVAIGQKQGQGVRMGSRCFWDSDTDNVAWYSYTGEDLFCVVAAFACYLY